MLLLCPMVSSLRSSIEFASLNRMKQALGEPSSVTGALTSQQLIPRVLDFELARARRLSCLPKAPPGVDSRCRASLNEEFLVLEFEIETAQTEDLMRLHQLAVSSPISGMRSSPVSGICRGHSPVLPERVVPALGRFFDWVRSPSFSELHPVEQMSLCQVRLYEIYPFEDACEVTVDLFACLFLRAGGYLTPFYELDQVREFLSALEAAFAFSMTELVELNRCAVERSYELALSGAK